MAASQIAHRMVSDAQRALLWVVFRDATQAKEVLKKMPIRELRRLADNAVDFESLVRHTLQEREK